MYLFAPMVRHYYKMESPQKTQCRQDLGTRLRKTLSDEYNNHTWNLRVPRQPVPWDVAPSLLWQNQAPYIGLLSISIVVVG